MAVTLTNLKTIVGGNSKRLVGTITGPASYTTGGEALTAAQIEQLTGQQSSTALTNVLKFSSDVNASFQQYVLDITNKKVLAVAGSTQVTSTTNLSAVSINFELIHTVANG